MHPWHEQTAEVAASLTGGSLAIPVMGVVEAWGRIEVDEDGFRAEFARPDVLILLPRTVPTHLRGDPHGAGADLPVEVLRLTKADSDVSYCADGAPG